MTLYCVRIPPNSENEEQADEFVGLFNASSALHLVYLVDECCDPSGLEYAVIPPGGIMWNGRGPKIRDLFRYDGEDDVVATFETGDGYSLSERWDFQALRFKPLPIK